MRSVFAFFHQSDIDKIIDCLNSFYDKYGNNEWVLSMGDSPALYIAFDDENYIMKSLKLEESQETKQLLSFLKGKGLDLSITIEISSKCPGTKEVLSFFKLLLSSFEGVALDDTTSHAWTLQEIVNRDFYQNRTFFDYIRCE